MWGELIFKQRMMTETKEALEEEVIRKIISADALNDLDNLYAKMAKAFVAKDMALHFDLNKELVLLMAEQKRLNALDQIKSPTFAQVQQLLINRMAGFYKKEIWPYVMEDVRKVLNNWKQLEVKGL